jgi:hypothetical protein
MYSPWWRPGTEVRIGDFVFTCKVPPQETDAALCYWVPDEDFLALSGPKAFYCAEPVAIPSLWQSEAYQRALKLLPQDEILRPAHPNPARRVVHHTHTVELKMVKSRERLERAVAVVQNNARHCTAWPEIKLRNRMIAHPKVDLFGPRESWDGYVRKYIFWGRPPGNYKGELDGDWQHPNKLELRQRYKVAVCLENSCEPFYFSEKFVDAVRAGCIPIYHAHQTVAEGILKRAVWVDPADCHFDPEETIRHALSQDIGRFQEINEKWLLSDEVAATGNDQIFRRIGGILQEMVAARLDGQNDSRTRC